jgi:hypothetical protein
MKVTGGPAQREECTITSIDSSDPRGVYLYLQGYDEWRLQPDGSQKLWSWHVSAFRPLITGSQEQDVGLFTHHLESTPVGEDA